MNPGENTDEGGIGAKLTGAQLKAQKKAEKAAKRAAEVAQRGAAQAPPSTPKPEIQRRPSMGKKDEGGHHKRAGSVPTTSKALPLRATTTEPEKKTVTEKKVEMFSHLYPNVPKPTLSTAGKEIHPTVLSLGQQLRAYVICGSTARTIAMLLVFKRVIADYTTPTDVALSRHLTSHLSHQITYLNDCRKPCVSQGNSVRWLKKLVSSLDLDLGEKEAKEHILEQLDGFIRERFTLADELICRSAGDKIKDRDVVLVYGKSSVVEKALIASWKAGKLFRVVVVDARPLFEGKNLAQSLANVGVPVHYCLLNGLADAIAKQKCTMCILGASSMLGNGRLYARAGSAMVAMMAKRSDLPVTVLCESIKFTGKVALDSVVMNEIGDADSLVEIEQEETLTTTVEPVAEPKKGGKSKKDEDEPDEALKLRGLEVWRDIQGLELLNLMYDVTPAEYLDTVITELGNLPPSAVPVVNGIHGGDE
jgi:translation initiation factor eIF-2B subunit delta